MTYHTNEELRAATAALAARASERAAVDAIGRTVEGRPIEAVTIAAPGRSPEGGRPKALVTANLHGAEVIGSEVALRLIELLAEGDPAGAAAALLDLADVTVVPVVNLDARAPSAAAARSRFSPARARRCNRHGVDLNRNFPAPAGARDAWHPVAGTSIRWLPWYRGPRPLSEPETQALARLCERLRPLSAVNLHSPGRLFLHPFACSPEKPGNVAAFRAMGKAFAESQPGARYKVRQSWNWYAILGDLDDWLYDRFGTLSVTVELSGILDGVGADPLRLLSPVAWVNPRRPEATIAETAESCLAALAEGCRQRLRTARAAG